MVDISKISDGTNTYDIKDSEARSELSNKQDTLVSGTNIKTINGDSILGSGNIVIETSSTPNVDGETISFNTSNALQSIAIKNKRDGSTLPIWHGTEQQWNQGVATTWHYWQTSTTALWTASTLPSSERWYSVAYGYGKFVAVAYNSNVSAYSTDGINWTASTLPSSEKWWSVAYGDGKFVAVAYSSNVSAYSTDGINWTESTLPSSAKWYSVAYGDGKFVVVSSSSNKSAYSTDGGATWTASTLPISAPWRAIAYGDGKFVVVGTDKAAYSTDGINWTESTMPYSAYWYSVAYGDGKFVVTDYESENSAYSTDGINWTASTLPSSDCWYSVTYGDGKFVAVSYDSNKSAYSTNGINWTESTMPDSANWHSVTYGDGKFVAVTDESDVSAIFTIQYDKCYTLDSTPTTSSQVYSAPETISTKTITSVDSGTITLSDNLVYNSTPSGNQNTYRTIGDAHTDWLCNIDNVGVKIGNTIVATAGSGSSYTAGDGIDITNNVISANIATSVSSSSTNADAVGAKLFYDTVGDIETALHTINSGGAEMVNLSWSYDYIYSAGYSIKVNGETVASSGASSISETLIGSYAVGSEVKVMFGLGEPISGKIQLYVNNVLTEEELTITTTKTYTFLLEEETVIRIVFSYTGGKD